MHDALLRLHQVSIDYVDEKDSIDKMRVGTAIGPILAWFFRNTPYFEGRLNPYPPLRQRMWDYLDFQRTNVTPACSTSVSAGRTTRVTCCPRR